MKAIMTQSLFRIEFNMFYVRLLFACGLVLGANAQTPWTYNNQNGWPDDKCKTGTKQSPIEINPVTTDFEMVDSDDPFTFENYDQDAKSSRLTNIGQIIEADFTFNKPVMISGGELKPEGQKYKLDRIHFHWGSSDGAEHQVGSSTTEQRAKRMEIQLIHVKDGFGTNYTKANMNSSRAQDTLAILSVLVELKKSDNTNLSKLIDAVDKVKAKDQNQTFSGIKLTDILPRNTHGFYRYEGSMTFPNCTESVIWTIFKDPIYISEAQLNKFKAVTSVFNNYRTPQSLGTRKIKDVETSMKMFSSSPKPIWSNMLPLTLLLPILKSL